MKTLMILFGLLFCTAIEINSGSVFGSEPFFTAPGHSCFLTVAEAADSSFTQADRDRMLRLEDRMLRLEERITRLEERIIRLEEGLKATNQKIDDGLKAVNQKIDDGLKTTNQRFDDLRGLMYVIISGMFVLIGFILWDRRTTLAPVARTTRELEARTEKLELVIREKAEKDPELKEALKHAGLL
ncbi:MAG: hypothetical protein HQL03_09300 [Nitrospirae bacterium]|nr:hypothetical protein [Nitrospirota bacterium]MBF0592517.1 hypothetical protein [Nitrospirota bacterium]